MTLKQVHILQIGPYGVPDSEEEMARTFTVHRLWDTEDTDKFYKETGPLMHVIAGRPYPWKQDSAFLAIFLPSKSPPSFVPAMIPSTCPRPSPAALW